MTEQNSQQAAYEYREPAVIREQGNRLKDAASVYLQQHAHNPVDWYPWGDEALERAKAEDRMVFLSIGYSSCHWCHVMEEEVFEDDGVAEFLNQNFVCIKVDREERPDIDAVYMEAMQVMTGGGGWPLNMFLTPDLKPIYGISYTPRDDFMSLCGQLKTAYETRRSEIEENGKALYEFVSSSMKTGDGAYNAGMPEAGMQAAKEAFDSDYGGFLGMQKFPTSLRWRFLLHYYRKTGDEDVARMITKTLDEMGRGGIRDHLGGGFHRYTTDRIWLVPHFEKMLYDNAQIASLYTEASVVFESDEYAEIARETLDFIIDQMSNENGGSGFYASYDADSGGVEGTYYIWKPGEITEIAGETEGPVLAALLGISETDNFQDHHGKASGSVISRQADSAAVAKQFGMTERDVNELFSKYRPALLEARGNRVQPGLDRKVVTSWNGLAISALALGSMVFNEQGYADAAANAARYLKRTHWVDGDRLLRSSTDAHDSESGVLDDYACLAEGLYRLYMATGEQEYLDDAVALTESAISLFANPEGGFYLTPEDRFAPLGRRTMIFDSVEPSGNSVILHVLQLATAATGEQRFLDYAIDTLGAYNGTLDRAGMETAWWLDAVLMIEGPFYEVVIAGEQGSTEFDTMVYAVQNQGLQSLLLMQVPAAGADQASVDKYPVLESRKAGTDGGPMAYVCTDGSCRSPTGSPFELEAQVAEGWLR